MKVVVVLPTYNERESIETLLEQLVAITGKHSTHTFMFLVVDDASPDGTGQFVEAYSRHHPNVYLLTGNKEGLGRAILRGMKYAAEVLKADIIGQMDADLSHDPNVLGKFIQKYDEGFHFVVGSRYIQGGSIPKNWGLHRKIFSVVGNAFVRYGLGFTAVHDWTGGYRLYARTYYELSRREMGKHKGYVFQIAFLYKSILKGAKVGEVPIHFLDRRFGHSKIAPSEYIRDVLVFVLRQRIKRLIVGPFLKVCIVGTIGFTINTILLETVVILGFHPTFGSAIGAEFAIVSNFLLNNHWTYRSRKIIGLRIIKKFFQFNTTSVGAILLQAGTVAVGTLLFGVPSYRFFYLIGVGFGLFWNYTMYSRLIWRQR